MKTKLTRFLTGWLMAFMLPFAVWSQPTNIPVTQTASVTTDTNGVLLTGTPSTNIFNANFALLSAALTAGGFATGNTNALTDAQTNILYLSFTNALGTNAGGVTVVGHTLLVQTNPPGSVNALTNNNTSTVALLGGLGVNGTLAATNNGVVLIYDSRGQFTITNTVTRNYSAFNSNGVLSLNGLPVLTNPAAFDTFGAGVLAAQQSTNNFPWMSGNAGSSTLSATATNAINVTLTGTAAATNDSRAVSLTNADNILQGQLTATGGNVVTNGLTFSVVPSGELFINSGAVDLGPGSYASIGDFMVSLDTSVSFNHFAGVTAAGVISAAGFAGDASGLINSGSSIPANPYALVNVLQAQQIAALYGGTLTPAQLTIVNNAVTNNTPTTVNLSVTNANSAALATTANGLNGTLAQTNLPGYVVTNNTPILLNLSVTNAVFAATAGSVTTTNAAYASVAGFAGIASLATNANLAGYATNAGTATVLTNFSLAHVLFVDANGNDSVAVRGDFTHAWRSIGTALLLATNGDTVKVGFGWGGDYTLPSNPFTPTNGGISIIGSGRDVTYLANNLQLAATSLTVKDITVGGEFLATNLLNGIIFDRTTVGQTLAPDSTVMGTTGAIQPVTNVFVYNSDIYGSATINGDFGGLWNNDNLYTSDLSASSATGGERGHEISTDNQNLVSIGGSMNMVVTKSSSFNPTFTNVWFHIGAATVTNISIRIYGTAFNHRSIGSAPLSFAFYNPLGCTNISGYYYDNGVLTYVQGTNIYQPYQPSNQVFTGSGAGLTGVSFSTNSTRSGYATNSTLSTNSLSVDALVLGANLYGVNYLLVSDSATNNVFNDDTSNVGLMGAIANNTWNGPAYDVQLLTVINNNTFGGMDGCLLSGQLTHNNMQDLSYSVIFGDYERNTNINNLDGTAQSGNLFYGSTFSNIIYGVNNSIFSGSRNRITNINHSIILKADGSVVLNQTNAVVAEHFVGGDFTGNSGLTNALNGSLNADTNSLASLKQAAVIAANAVAGIASPSSGGTSYWANVSFPNASPDGNGLYPGNGTPSVITNWSNCESNGQFTINPITGHITNLLAGTYIITANVIVQSISAVFTNPTQLDVRTNSVLTGDFEMVTGLAGVPAGGYQDITLNRKIQLPANTDIQLSITATIGVGSYQLTRGYWQIQQLK